MTQASPAPLPAAPSETLLLPEPQPQPEQPQAPSPPPSPERQLQPPPPPPPRLPPAVRLPTAHPPPPRPPERVAARPEVPGSGERPAAVHRTPTAERGTQADPPPPPATWPRMEPPPPPATWPRMEPPPPAPDDSSSMLSRSLSWPDLLPTAAAAPAEHTASPAAPLPGYGACAAASAAGDALAAAPTRAVCDGWEGDGGGSGDAPHRVEAPRVHAALHAALGEAPPPPRPRPRPLSSSHRPPSPARSKSPRPPPPPRTPLGVANGPRGLSPLRVMPAAVAAAAGGVGTAAGTSVGAACDRYGQLAAWPTVTVAPVVTPVATPAFPASPAAPPSEAAAELWLEIGRRSAELDGEIVRRSMAEIDLSAFEHRSLRDSVTGDLRPSLRTRLTSPPKRGGGAQKVAAWPSPDGC